MAHTLTNLLYHIVFSTKDRQPLIGAEFEDRIYQYLGGIVRGDNGIALEINGMPDHVHILAKLSQNKSIKDVLRDLKADSSGWIHRTFPSLKKLHGRQDIPPSRSASLKSRESENIFKDKSNIIAKSLLRKN